MQQEPLLWHSLELDPLGSFSHTVPTERYFCQISLMKINTATSLGFRQVLDDTIEWRSATSQKLKFVNL